MAGAALAALFANVEVGAPGTVDRRAAAPSGEAEDRGVLGVVELDGDARPAPGARGGDDAVADGGARGGGESDGGGGGGHGGAGMQLQRPTCAPGVDCLTWSRELPGRGPVWRHVSADPTAQPPLLVLTDRLGTLALDLRDGSEQWRIEADPTAPVGTRAHGLSASRVVLIERDGVVRGYDRATGSWEWLAPLPGAVQVRHARDYGEVVVVAADASSGAGAAVRLAAAFDRVSGERRWQRRSGNVVLAAAGPIAADGSGRLRVLDPTDGSVRHEAVLSHPIATLVATGDLVVAVGWEGTTLLDASTDEVLLALDVGARLLHRDPDVAVLLGDEELIVTRADGTWWRASTGPTGTAPRAGVTDDAIWLRDRDGTGWRFDLDGRLRAEGVTRVGAIDLAGPLELRPGAAARGAEFAPLEIREALGGVIATTPPGAPIAALPDGVVLAGSGWVVRVGPPAAPVPTPERRPQAAAPRAAAVAD